MSSRYRVNSLARRRRRPDHNQELPRHFASCPHDRPRHAVIRHAVRQDHPGCPPVRTQAGVGITRRTPLLQAPCRLAAYKGNTRGIQGEYKGNDLPLYSPCNLQARGWPASGSWGLPGLGSACDKSYQAQLAAAECVAEDLPVAQTPGPCSILRQIPIPRCVPGYRPTGFHHREDLRPHQTAQPPGSADVVRVPKQPL